MPAVTIANGFSNVPNIDTFEYNDFGELTSAKVNGVTSTYTYRADGLRWYKTVNGTVTRHLWDGDDVIMDMTDAYAVTNKYTRGLGLIRYTDGTNTKYYTRNRHGDTNHMIDAATYSIANTYKYDAYGNQESISSTDTNPFRYSGEYYDYETGFIYLRARYYDPSAGRFLTEDTHWNVDNMIFGDKEYKDGETNPPDITAIMQSNNLYAYGIGNPVMFVDPSGEVAEWIFVALYAYVQAVLASPDLQFDMQMLAYDISQGDYVSAAFGLVDILTPGFSGSKSVPKIIRKYFDDVVGFVGSTGNRAVSNIPLQRISHIVNGSKYNDHLWRNVTDNVNWNNIKKIISDTIDNGVVVSEKTYINNNILTKVYTVIKEYKGNTVEVKYRIINGVVEVTDAWVRK